MCGHGLRRQPRHDASPARPLNNLTLQQRQPSASQCGLPRAFSLAFGGVAGYAYGGPGHRIPAPSSAWKAAPILQRAQRTAAMRAVSARR